MNITTTTVTTRKTTVSLLQAEIEDIILCHLRDKHGIRKDSPEFFWSGSNGGVAIDFVEEDCTVVPDPDGWIPWSADAVSLLNSSSLVKYRDGGSGYYDSRSRWYHIGAGGDIVAYRIRP